MITSSEKKKIFRKLEKKHGKKRAATVVQATKLYYAIKMCIENVPGIYICGDGFNDRWLKYYLRFLLGDKYHEQKIKLLHSLKPLFGKKNIADRLAWSITKEGKKPTMMLKEKHFKKLKLL